MVGLALEELLVDQSGGFLAADVVGVELLFDFFGLGGCGRAGGFLGLGLGERGGCEGEGQECGEAAAVHRGFSFGWMAPRYIRTLQAPMAVDRSGARDIVCASSVPCRSRDRPG